MSIFKLSQELTLINGKTLNELNLEYDKLTTSDLKTANKIANLIGDNDLGTIDNSTLSPRLNANLRIGIAWAAAIKGTPGLTMNDILQLGLNDSLCLSEECLSSYLFR